MANIVPFQFGPQEVSVHLDESGNPWWVLTECTQAIGLTNPSEVVKRLDAEDLRKIEVLDARGVAHETWMINESGLYTLLLRSHKPAARPFRRWVTSEVLPSLRTVGSYHVKAAKIQVRNPANQLLIDTVIRLDEVEQRAVAAEERSRRAEAQAQEAQAQAERALEAKDFYTVAEYVTFNKLEHQLYASDYRSVSEHLQAYCLEKRIPFRRIPVGGKPWETEYGYHVSVYTEALPGWLTRRFAQPPLMPVRRLRKETS